MKKSSGLGPRTSREVEVLGLTPHALWLMVRNRELMLDFVNFPWFRRATMDQVCDVALYHGEHLHWPQLDVDLHVDSIEHPERFPLIAEKRRASRRRRR